MKLIKAIVTLEAIENLPSGSYVFENENEQTVILVLENWYNEFKEFLTFVKEINFNS